MLVQKHAPKTMRDYNKKMHFNLVRTFGPLSRASLSRMTGMSPTSSGRIINGLISEGVICEDGEVDGNVGRKATLLKVVDDGILAVGVSVDANRISAGLVNAGGEITLRHDEYNSPDNDQTVTLELIKACINAVLSKVDEECAKRVLGIGLSVAGAVNWETGTVLYSPQLNWTHLPLKQLLENSYKYDLVVENNVKATAQAISIFGSNEQSSDFLVIELGSGIGSALFANGRLIRGGRNLAGEIGHISLDGISAQCDCGRRGCMQSELCMLAIEHISGLPFSLVVKQAEDNDESCAALLNRVATEISRWIANTVNLYDPPVVLLCGDMLVQWPELMQLIVDRHRAFLWGPAVNELQIRKFDVPLADMPILSAASIILSEILEPVSFYPQEHN